MRNPFVLWRPDPLAAINYGFPSGPASFAPFEMGCKSSQAGKRPRIKVEKLVTVDWYQVEFFCPLFRIGLACLAENIY